MDEARLTRCADIGAEMNPAVRAPDEAATAGQVRIDSQKAELVPAAGDEQAIARRPRGRQRPHHFQPAGETTAALARALPPAAAWRHDDQRRKLRVAPRNLRNDVAGVRHAPPHVGDERRLRVRLRLLLEPLRLHAGDLQHWRAERLGEGQCVDQEQPRHAAAREQDHRLVPAASGSRHGVALLLVRVRKRKRFGFRERDLGIAAQQAEPPVHAVDAGERGIERRHATDAATGNAQIAGTWVDPVQRKRLLRASTPACRP